MVRSLNRLAALVLGLAILAVANAAKGYSNAQRVVATGELVDVFCEAGEAYGIDWRLLMAQCWKESNFVLNARGAAGERGMAQFMPATWQRFGQGDPDDPRAAALAQARYLRYIADYLNTSDVAIIIAAYNAGEGSAGARNRNFADFPASTRAYTTDVLRRYELLKRVWR